MIVKARKTKPKINRLRPIEVVDITNPLEKSLQGKYFLGQTEILSLGNNINAWGALINPRNSGINLHVNAFTATNMTQNPFTAQIWFNPQLPGSGTESYKVTSANTALYPVPKPKVKLKYEKSIEGVPVNGVNAFDRLVSPYSTIASDENGKFIIPPGGSFALFLESPGPILITAIIAFGWWEEKI